MFRHFSYLITHPGLNSTRPLFWTHVALIAGSDTSALRANFSSVIIVLSRLDTDGPSQIEPDPVKIICEKIEPDPIINIFPKIKPDPITKRNFGR